MTEIPRHPFLDHLKSGMTLICAEGDDRPTPAQLDELEQEIGRKLHGDYRALQEKYGAFCLEVKEELWPRPKALDVGPMWTFNYAFAVVGLGVDVPELLDMRSAVRSFRAQDPERSGWLPVFCWFSGSGDWICYDENDRLFEWRHGDEPQPLEGSLDDYLVEQARYLAERKHEMAARLTKRET